MSQTTNNSILNGVDYMPFNCPPDVAAGQTLIQGIRGVDGSDNVYIAGSIIGTDNIWKGLIYDGPLAANGTTGKWNVVVYTAEGVDDVVNTSCYGPNNATGGNVQIVGAYKRTSVGDGNENLGFYYEGPADGSGTWLTISPNNGNTSNVFMHSIMGGLAVGNYAVPNVKSSNAFIYDVQAGTYTDFTVDGYSDFTLYGIWHNGGTSYTLAGGCKGQAPDGLAGFLADYDSATKATTNMTLFNYDNKPVNTLFTHFEGITVAEDGYNMAADWAAITGDKKEDGALAHVKRNPDGSFCKASWTEVRYPTSTPGVTSANTVYQNNILGIYVTGEDKQPVINAYNAKVIGQ